MSNNPRETLEDRLAKRRYLRHKRYSDKSFADESEITLINHSPTTQSLDRNSSKRISKLSPLNSLPDQPKSSTIIKNTELPPIETSHSKQNYVLPDDKTNSAPLLPQLTKNQSLESQNKKPASSKSLSTNALSYQREEPVIPLATTEKSTPIHEDSHENEKPAIIKENVTPVLPSILPPATTEKYNPVHEDSHENEKPAVIKENVTPILPSILPPVTTEKSNPILREALTNSTLNRTRHFSQPSELDHPLSHPQSTINHQQNDFNLPPFYQNPVTRTASDQIVSLNKPKHQPTDSMFAKKNSLALSYLFSKRMINAELGRTSLFDSDQSQRKTVWD